MSESVHSPCSSFDIEAQQSLLQEEECCIVDQETGRSTKSKNWIRLILLVRSVQVFKSASSSTQIEITLTQIQDSVIDESSAESAEASLLECQPQLNELQREKIVDIVRNKNFQEFVNFGGVQGVVEALNTDVLTGKANIETSQVDPKQVLILKIIIFHSFLGACKTPTVVILSFAAALSLVFGIMEEDVYMRWFNGATVMFTIFVIVTFTAIHDSREVIKSKKRFENITTNKKNVRVVRSGYHVFVPAYQLQVGDIAFLQKGDQVLADGIFVPGDQPLEINNGMTQFTTINVDNPFLFYGSKVMEGSCRMIVISVGTETLWAEKMREATDSSDDKCKFESYLHKLNSCLHLIGICISILVLALLFIRYTTGKLDNENGFKPDLKGEPSRVIIMMRAIRSTVTGSRGTTKVLVTLLSVSLVGIMEGMPFVISLAIAIFNEKIIVPNKATVRDDLGCVKMASLTTICTDKFGGLTENEIVVNRLYIGEEFVSESSVVASHVREGLCDAIGTLCLAPSIDCESKALPLVMWAEAKLGMRKESLGDRCKMMKCNVCNPSQDQCSQMLIKKNGEESYLHYKGPPSLVIRLCTHYYNMAGEVQPINDRWKRVFNSAVDVMHTEDAEVVVYSFKGINNTDGVSTSNQDHVIFLGMIGMISTKREETKIAILTLMESGIRTILVHDIAVLETIGQNCGILADESTDLVVTGENFREWTDEEKREKVENIRILGNCLPSDRSHLIKCLRENGDVVALLAQQTLDAPALKQANVGLTIGTWSSDVARESAHINLWKADFGFLVDIVEKGRSFQANVRKFIQLQIITTMASLCINLLSIVFFREAAMTVIQLFWLNLVITVFGGLALLLGPSTEILMRTGAMKSSLGMIITKAMWRNIAFQVSYLTTVFVTLQHKGLQGRFGISGDRVKSMGYNGFFICNIFNKFIARQPTGTNIFKGVFHKNVWFFVATGVILICEVIFGLAEVVIGNNPLLNWKLCCLCIVLGLACVVVDWIGKKITSYLIRE